MMALYISFRIIKLIKERRHGNDDRLSEHLESDKQRNIAEII